MTGRERLRAILHKQPTDRLSWTTLVDNTTLLHFPKELQCGGGIDFYRHLGCDIFLLNGWNTAHSFRSPELRWHESVQEIWRRNNDTTIREWRTPRGTLTGTWQGSHPIKYPVDSIDAVRIYHEMWEGAGFVEHDETQALAAIDTLVAEDGVITRFWGPSTIPRLLENDMGIEQFYYLLFDHAKEMKELITIMHERELAAFGMLANGPWESVTLCENTSTFYISPEIYEQYNMPHQRDFVHAVHTAGKPALLHMCGHVFDILDLIKETHCDGIHTLTPPPTGNTPWETALDILGEDTVIFGALDPSIFISGPVQAIGPAMDELISPRLRQANFVLCPMADGIQVPLDRFVAVKEWMEHNRV